MKKLNNVSNNFKGGVCMDCLETVSNCYCNELAFTELEEISFEGNKYLVSNERHRGFDCDTCTSYSCTECPRYTNC